MREGMSEKQIRNLKPLIGEDGKPVYNEHFIMIMEDGLPWCEHDEKNNKDYLEFETFEDSYKGKKLDKTISTEKAKEIAKKYKKSLNNKEDNNKIIPMKEDILEM